MLNRLEDFNLLKTPYRSDKGAAPQTRSRTPFIFGLRSHVGRVFRQ